MDELDSLIEHSTSLAAVARGEIRLEDLLDRNPATLMLCNYRLRSVDRFAEKLKTNRSLLGLDMKRTGIDDRDAACIAEALRCNTTLVFMHLGNNLIGDVGAVALGMALRQRPVRTVIMIGNNHRMTAIGRNALRDALENKNVTVYV